MSEMTTITATPQLAAALKRRHNLQQYAEERTTWSPPSIRHLSQWAKDVWTDWLYSGHAKEPRLPLRRTEEIIWWEDIIGNSGGERLLDVTAAANLASSTWRLVCEWHISLGQLTRNHNGSGGSFADWARDFKRRCEDKRRLSEVEMITEVANLIQTNEVPVPAAIELRGFLDLTPVQQWLVDALRDKGTRVNRRPLPDCNHTAFRLSLADTEEEIQCAAMWARNILQSDPCADSPTVTIGVIVPDLERLRSRIERVFGEVIHSSSWMDPEKNHRRLFSISAKRPCSHFPIIKAALDILQVNPKSIPIGLASRILRSPFLACAESEMTRRARLDIKLRARGDAHVTLREIQSLADREGTAFRCPELVALLRSWNGEHGNPKSDMLPSKWSAEFSELLESATWPKGRDLSNSETQEASELSEILDELASTDGAAKPMSRPQAVELLMRIAADRSFEPKADLAPIQILRPNDAAGMEFDQLWIMGMHDGAWPPVTGPNPLLPGHVQQQKGLPGSTALENFSRATKLTKCLRSCAPVIVVSHPRREADSDLRISPLFSDLKEVSTQELGLSKRESHLESLWKSRKLEQLEDHFGPPCDDSDQKGGTDLFKAQAECPFKAFAELRLGASVPEWPDPGLSGKDRGRLVHQVLEGVWTELQTQESLIAKPQAELLKIVESVAEAKISGFVQWSNARKGAQTEDIERSRLVNLVLKWLDLEKDRTPFTVVEQEEARNVELGGVKTIVRIDRVDRLEDGRLVITDYKTGKCGIPDWKGERPDEPQLPVYACTSRDQVAGVFYGGINTDRVGFVGLADEDIIPGRSSGLADAQLEWKDVLERLGKEFMSGHALVDPKDRSKTCRNCSLPGFCRIGTNDTEDG